MKKTYILIFVLLFFAVSFVLINRFCQKMFSSGDSMPETEMTDVNLYFFDYGDQKKKDYILFDFNADKCFLSHNFRNFSAEDINGNLYINKKYKFDCENLVSENREQVLAFTKFRIYRDNKSFADFTEGKVDFLKRCIESDNKVYYKSDKKYGTSEYCYIDLDAEIIKLKKSEMFIEVD